MIVPMRDKPTKFDGDIPWIRIEDFNGKYISDSKSRQYVSKELVKGMNLKVFPIGTVLCTCSCSMGATAIVEQPLISNQTFIGIVPGENLDSEYLFYLMQASAERLQLFAQGAIQQYLSKHNFEHLKIPLPSLKIQKRLLVFLNRKLKDLDELIENKKQLIDLLEEKRQTLITEAVTRGLNPNVKMKDSGVEWIGEIPEHWTIKKIKHISNLVGSGKTPKGGSEIYPESGVLFLRSMNVHYDGIRLKDIVHITPEIDEDMRSTRVKSKDVLLNITGASIGRSCIVPESLGKANVNQHVCIIRSNTKVVVPELLSKIMASNFIMQQILMSQNGSSREGLNFTQVKNLEFPLTRDLQEQIEIANHISVETNKINSLIGMIEEQIQKLKEYRQSLIYEVVTGKIDVRDFEVKA
ncbi:hypothetical protein bthur0004_8820 [Bacillus thuringiensis serovar sotto str. T04001]|nr:hypothetical protein bthur0004_8820 [Bacillus thuringiensis serovar sotto str. T04001]